MIRLDSIGPPTTTLSTSSPADTWAGILTAGLIAALVGAAGTVIAVVVTIRFERQQRELDRLEEAAAGADAAIGAFIADMAANGMAIDDRSRASFSPMLQAISATVTRAKRTDHNLAAVLINGADAMSAAMSELSPDPATHRPVAETAQLIGVTISEWQADPEPFRYGMWTYDMITKLSERAKQGKGINIGHAVNFPFPSPGRARKVARWLHLPRRTWYGTKSAESASLGS